MLRKQIRQSLVMPVLFIALLSCRQNQQDYTSLVQDFATVECRRIELQQQSLKVLGKIRFAQDSLLHATTKVAADSLQTNLSALQKQKEDLLHASLLLSDSMKQQLDTLMHNRLTTSQQKNEFNQKLTAELQARGCVE